MRSVAVSMVEFVQTLQEVHYFMAAFAKVILMLNLVALIVLLGIIK